jgi:hypothetical protein
VDCTYGRPRMSTTAEAKAGNATRAATASIVRVLLDQRVNRSRPIY